MLDLEAAQKLGRVVVGQVGVEEDERVVADARSFHGLVGRCGGVDGERLVAQDGEQHHPQDVVIFDDQNS